MKQQIGEYPKIPVPQRVEQMRQGEHGMRVAHRQELSLASQQPLSALARRTPGAGPMPAALIKDAFDVTMGAAFHMPPEGGGVAGHDHPDRLANMVLERLRLGEAGVMGRQQVNEPVGGRLHHVRPGRV